MIRRHQLAKACSTNDDYATGGRTLALSLPNLGFNAEDAGYVAIQRAIRMLAVMKGSDASKLTISDLQRMPERDRMLVSAFAAVYIDGLASGARALLDEGR